MITSAKKLIQGPGSVRRNVELLMQAPASRARKRAIATIAKKNNEGPQAAQFRQALAISRSLARKPKV